MKAPTRVLAALLLALVLPIQGWAAACAQICARVAHEREAAVHVQHEMPGTVDDEVDHGHCGKSEMGAGKCCQAHVFMTPDVHTPDAERPASAVVAPFAAAWTSFIPEEPSPPPIVSLPRT